MKLENKKGSSYELFEQAQNLLFFIDNNILWNNDPDANCYISTSGKQTTKPKDDCALILLLIECYNINNIYVWIF